MTPFYIALAIWLAGYEAMWAPSTKDGWDG